VKHRRELDALRKAERNAALAGDRAAEGDARRKLNELLRTQKTLSDILSGESDEQDGS
jgi:hypothetical protein